MWQFLQAPMLGGPALIRHLCAPAAGVSIAAIPASTHAGWLGPKPKLPSSPQCNSQFPAQPPSSHAAPDAAPSCQFPEAPGDTIDFSESAPKDSNCIAILSLSHRFSWQTLPAPMPGGSALNRSSQAAHNAAPSSQDSSQAPKQLPAQLPTPRSRKPRMTSMEFPKAFRRVPIASPPLACASIFFGKSC